jgi:hypothetical protein
MAKNSASYERQFTAIDNEHAARNRKSDAPSMTSEAGGSASFTDPGPKGKSPSMGGTSDVKAIGRLAGGRPDTAKKSKRVG